VSALGKSHRVQLGLTTSNGLYDTNGVLGYASYMQSATIAEKIKNLKEEIKAIEQVNREYRKIKYPGYPAQKVYEDRLIRLVQIQEEIKALLRT
jgi:hypothetical protein